jgi:eukaryotic-like serine/threonine-protein kinase
MQHPKHRPDSRPTAPAQPLEPERDELLDQLRAGTVVDGLYRIEETLGRGAMGVVVSARQVKRNERLALKFLDTRIRVTVDDFYARFRREARVNARLRNEHVARVVGTGLYLDRHPYMVMDYLSGIDLKKVREAAGGAVPAELAVEYAVQICQGLAEPHALGIVHRDLKPSNILVTRRADGSELIKILDFGICKWTASEEQQEEITLTGVVLGSPKYMAPEQLFGAAHVDARADVWSMGVILYELLTGRPPFDASSLTQLSRALALNHAPASMNCLQLGIPPAVETVVQRCLAHDPNQRLATVAELAFALLEAIESAHASLVYRQLSAVLEPNTAVAGAAEDRHVRVSGTFVRQADGAYRGDAGAGEPAPQHVFWFETAAVRRGLLAVWLVALLVAGWHTLRGRAHVTSPTQVIAVTPEPPRAPEPLAPFVPLAPTPTAIVPSKPATSAGAAPVRKGLAAVAKRAPVAPGPAPRRATAPSASKAGATPTAQPGAPADPLQDRL